MTKTDRVHSLVDQIEEDAQKSTVRDILIDLRECVETANSDDRPGLIAAIEMIESNYSH